MNTRKKLCSILAVCAVLCLLDACAQQGADVPPEVPEKTHLTENALEHMSAFDAFAPILDVGPRPGAYVVRDDGTLWSGLYDLCPSGRDDGENVWGKVLLDGVPKFLHIGQWGAAALTEDGIVWSWGDDRFFPLGRDDGENRGLPGQVMDGVRQMDMYYDVAAVKEDDTLWVWGGFGIRVPFPEQVMEDVLCTSVTRNDLILALKRDGTLWSIEGEPNEDESAVIYTVREVLNGESGQPLENVAGLNDNIVCTEDGSYWAITGEPDPSTQVKAYPLDEPPASDIYEVEDFRTHVYIDQEGRLWANAEDHTNANKYGIYSVDDLTEHFLLDEDVVYANAAEMWIFYIKRDGTLWLIQGGASEDGSNPFGKPELVLDHVMLPK